MTRKTTTELKSAVTTLVTDAAGSTSAADVRSTLNQMIDSLPTEGVKYLSEQVGAHPTTVPILVKTEVGETKSDYLAWSQAYDETIHDSGPAFDAILDDLTANSLLTGGTVSVGPGFWNVATAMDAANDRIIALGARQKITSSDGSYHNTAVLRDVDTLGHLIGIIPGTADSGSEGVNMTISYIWLDGCGNKGSAARIYDTINAVKPINNNYGDMKLNVKYCRISNGLRHNIYYSARGDSHFSFLFNSRAGGSDLVFDGAIDSYVNDSLFVGAGNHPIEIRDTANIEIKSCIGYFCGGNRGGFWDGSNANDVRMNGGGFKVSNSRAIRWLDGRIEDSTGTALIFDECTGLRFEGYMNNIGSVGSFAQVTAGTKDFGVNGVTATVEGVPLIYSDRGGRPSTGVNIKAFVRQARGTQQLSSLVYLDPPNQHARAYEDWNIEIEEWFAGDAAVERRLDDNAAWTESGNVTFWNDTFVMANRQQPAFFKRCKMTFNGLPMAAFHNRIQNTRHEEHNCYDQWKRYVLDVPEVTANVSAVTWGERANWQNATLTVDADLTATLTEKHAVSISGMGNSLLNGVFNVVGVTATTIEVNVREDRSGYTMPSDTTGETGTLSGPVARLVLQEDYVPGMTYCVEVTDKDVAAADMVVYLKDSDTEVTLSANGKYYFEYTPSGGWAQII